jgi:hypothetical protein
VANIAAKSGTLPESFDAYDMRHAGGGWTVAHIAAKYGTLPDNFSQWDLADNEGVTVAKVAKGVGGISALQYSAWEIVNRLVGVLESDQDDYDPCSLMM